MSVFTSAEINRFCEVADDGEHLVSKIILIFALAGGCKVEELANLTIEDVEDCDDALLVRLPQGKTGIERNFVITGNYYRICKKYVDVRIDFQQNDRFFLKMCMGKCVNKPLGINKIGGIPQEIAIFLELPNPESYTKRSFRKTSATLFANFTKNTTALKVHLGYK
ncbi:hypothetical protein TKK_0001922 [Trichogramma kaykai]|uniref:Tyr recombinase domain-containing protein n=1 Tax=Trichogramma kaykai TaxID=54128 RepID=A0ABD2W5Z0_9HYME